MPLTILLRGGGDLSSGVAYRLIKAGWWVAISELPRPMAVRRMVSFSQAVYSGGFTIEGIEALRIDTTDQALPLMKLAKIPVCIDPEADMRDIIHPDVIIDGRMTKRQPENQIHNAALVIGLGPGFNAGVNCHAVIETMRGPFLGRVYWMGSAEADSGLPDTVGGRREERVLRAPAAGEFHSMVEIGARVEEHQVIGEVDGELVRAPFAGLLRGLIYPGITVEKGVKIGDIDPRFDPRLCDHISDKALSIGGGVLEAILSFAPLRDRLWE